MDIQENQGAGYYRLKVYDAIQQTLDRKLTDNEHEYIKKIMVAFEGSVKVTQKVVTTMPPMVHKYICDNCKVEVIKVGQKQNKPFAKLIKRTLKEIGHELQKKEEEQQGEMPSVRGTKKEIRSRKPKDQSPA